MLKLLGDGQSRHLQEAATELADVFHLTDEDRSAQLASGYPIVRHRTGWAGFHLRKAGLVEDGQKGILKITDEGKAVLASNPSSLADTVLIKFPKYLAWRDAVSEVGAEAVTLYQGIMDGTSDTDKDGSLTGQEGVREGRKEPRSPIVTANQGSRIRLLPPPFPFPLMHRWDQPVPPTEMPPAHRNH